MTGKKSLFSSLDTCYSKESVLIADGGSCDIVGSCSVNPTPSLSLSSVLYIQIYPFNLLSVSKLTKALNSSVRFYPSSFFL